RPRRLRPSAGGHGDVDYRNGRRHRRGSVDRSASMSETSDIKGTDTPGQQGVPGQPSDAELASMSREQLVELGGKLDGVETVFIEDRWPVPDTKAEKRAERAVAYWLLLGGFAGLALLLIFLFWPWEYKPLGSEG